MRKFKGWNTNLYSIPENALFPEIVNEVGFTYS